MRRSGFTLIEVLIVIILVGLLAALAWPEFMEYSRAANLGESALRMKAAMSMCRAEAMNNARRYRISIGADGRALLRQQRDPLLAPQEFVQISAPWANDELLLEQVWITDVTPLPDGPPPIIVEDQTTNFTTVEVEPVPTKGMEAPLEINFEPDGSSSSARLMLRDSRGRGAELTLDGRLGRVDINNDVERLPQGEWSAPPPALETKEKALEPLTRRR